MPAAVLCISYHHALLQHVPIWITNREPVQNIPSPVGCDWDDPVQQLRSCMHYADDFASSSNSMCDLDH